MAIHEELANLYKEQIEIRKKLSQIDSKIGQIQKELNEDTITKTMSTVLDDDKEFIKWFTKRRQRIQNIEKKKAIKDKIEKGMTLNEDDLFEESTYIYSLEDRGKIVYIGITKNIEERIKQHKRTDKVFDTHKILNIFQDRFYALREENNLIKEHKPKYNKQIF
jgi:predicted GIY-YIG superfamily endonuclease